MPSSQESNAVWTEQKVIAIDGTEQAWFGLTIAIYGNTAMVGAMNAPVDGKPGQGAVYVFKKVGYVWQQTHKLVANDGMAGDQFGGAIALLGTTVVITAPLARIDGKTWQGATYVFSLSGTTWAQKQKLIASNGTAYATFGKSVALNGNSLFIGAGGAGHVGSTIPRSVYVFRLLHQRNGDAWIERQILEAPNPHDLTSSFGTAIAVSDTTALIGARSATIKSVLGQGAVYGYTDVNGNWTLTNTLLASDGAVRDNFGTSIALLGSTALIGSPGVFKGPLSVGAVYRFDHKDGNWLQAQVFHAADTKAVNFGATVSRWNDEVLVGAYAADSYRGTAYVFQEQAGVWTQLQQLVASDGTPGNVFGYTTALNAGTAMVGSFSADVGGNADQGAVYFYNAPQVGGPGLG
ncbi:MAG: FG-GAP repeat protein [Dokdonella sp.]